MFEKEEEVEYLEKDAVVYCDSCGVVIKKGFEYSVSSNYLPDHDYCERCKKPYKRIDVDFPFYNGVIVKHYFTDVEVDEKGKPIKK